MIAMYLNLLSMFRQNLNNSGSFSTYFINLLSTAKQQNPGKLFSFSRKLRNFLEGNFLISLLFLMAINTF